MLASKQAPCLWSQQSQVEVLGWKVGDVCALFSHRRVQGSQLSLRGFMRR